MARRKKNKKFHGAVSSLIIFTFIIAIASLVLSKIGFQAYKTSIENGVLNDSLIVINNIFSIQGLRFIIGNVVTNFKNFEPLVLVIISLIGIGIWEKSGFLDAIFSKGKNIKFGFVIFLTLLAGIASSIIGQYSYIFLIPFVGAMYKYLGRSSILGILTVFIGITLGYGTGLMFNYDDYSLGLLTETAAIVDVDKNYSFNLFSSMYIMVASTFALAYVAYLAVNYFLVPKFPKKQSIEEENLIYSKKGLVLSLLAGAVGILIIIYMLLDIALPGAGILLDNSATSYIAKLFSENSPFQEGIIVIIVLIMMIIGFVYGKISGNIKTSNEYSLGLSKNFENLGYLFVLMFFASQMLAILDWTNLGQVITARLIMMISTLQFSGLALIIIFFGIVVLASILIPDTYTKWELMSSTVVPLFMRSNIAPDFTQFVFRIADSVGKAFSPLFIYFIVMLAFLEKYRNDDKKEISFLSIMRMTLPTIIILGIFWILFISLWYLIGLPIGVGTYTTL